MGVSEQHDKAKCKHEIELWLENRRIPNENYNKLNDYFKDVLHNSVCVPTKSVSIEQRKGLYKILCAPEAGRHLTSQVEMMTDEKLTAFFSPLSPTEKITYFDKF